MTDEEPEEADVEGQEILGHEGVVLSLGIGTARRTYDVRWDPVARVFRARTVYRCLTNIRGALCLIEGTIRRLP